MCGSGMRAMMFAHDMLAAGSANVMVAGGMESMTNAPHLMFARKSVKYESLELPDRCPTCGMGIPTLDRQPACGHVVGLARAVYTEEDVEWCVAARVVVSDKMVIPLERVIEMEVADRLVGRMPVDTAKP
jgi:hypothetical protein